MNKTFVKCALIGGAVVFLWGMISWMVLPWHAKTMMPFKDEHRVATVIQENAMEDGMYVLPYFFSKQQAEKKKMEQGPFVFAAIHSTGWSKFSAPVHYLISLITQVVLAGIAVSLLARTKGLSYMQQVGFVMTVGIFAGIASMVPSWNWMAFSPGYTIVSILDLAIGWMLGGFVIAKLAKR